MISSIKKDMLTVCNPPKEGDAVGMLVFAKNEVVVVGLTSAGVAL